jgi:hypothetical protein
MPAGYASSPGFTYSGQWPRRFVGIQARFSSSIAHTAFAISTTAAIDELAREPLRHVGLLKQLLAYPDRGRVHRASGRGKSAILLALDVAATAYDRRTYPQAATGALIASDHPDLTAALSPCLPRDTGVVFKLSGKADLIPIESKFSVERRMAFVSFTSAAAVAPDPAASRRS